MRLPISRDGSAIKLIDELVDRYSRYDVLTYASAIAVQLTLVGYLYTSAIVFLTGALIDQLARERTDA